MYMSVLSKYKGFFFSACSLHKRGIQASCSCLILNVCAYAFVSLLLHNSSESPKGKWREVVQVNRFYFPLSGWQSDSEWWDGTKMRDWGWGIVLRLEKRSYGQGQRTRLMSRGATLARIAMLTILFLRLGNCQELEVTSLFRTLLGVAGWVASGESVWKGTKCTVRPHTKANSLQHTEKILYMLHLPVRAKTGWLLVCLKHWWLIDYNLGLIVTTTIVPEHMDEQPLACSENSSAVMGHCNFLDMIIIVLL